MSATTTSRRLATAGAIAWMIVIFVLSAQSTLPRTGGFPVDVAAVAGHVVAYAVLATLLRIALGEPYRDRRADLIAVGLATLYGLTDEWHQSFVPGRDASAFDLAVDAVGAVAGVTAINVVRAFRHISGEMR